MVFNADHKKQRGRTAPNRAMSENVSIVDTILILEEIKGIVTDCLPADDNKWEIYMAALLRAKMSLEYELMNEDDLK